MNFANAAVGQYMPGESLMHRLDPRTKMLVSLGIIIVLFVVSNPLAYALLAVPIVLAIAISGVPVKLVFRSLRPLTFIMVLTFVLHLFMDPGEALFSIGRITATDQGLRLGIVTVVRLTLLVLATSIVTMTTSPIAFTDGLERLLAPFARLGLPAHELAMMMTIALRFIPTLLEETDKIMKAQMARGADFESGNIAKRAKAMIPILVPLFVSAFRRADELAVAMEARCYRGGEGRTRLRELAFSGEDLAVLIVAGAYTVAVAVAL
ncbi:MAG: energy-coupling factor transporter transmembrane component T [Firmicutes bacterium]|jgi:energy-coupling factor transport system permease protein|nr:energy-coupling factor transporter transmembrane component T [Bacillota bacterium]MDD4335996.1 energy-coupling factor transporter transmembrane component T [Bacillota bacterium]MDD4791540.1 energy-coupling factor transporter transmembrane component T [Bacillota bacterium]